MKRRCGHLARAALPFGLAMGLHVAPVAGQPQPTDSTAERLLADCQRSPAFGGTSFDCQGFVAAVSEVKERSPSEALEAFLVVLRAQGEVTTAATTFAAVGKEWPGFVFSLRPHHEAKKGLEGTLLAFEAGKGTTRVVFCGTPPAEPALIERCRKLLPLLAETGPAPFRIPSSGPTFLGRALAIPDGCETVDATDKAFTVRCGETVALMSIKVRKLEEIPTAVGALSEALLRVPGATAGRDQACRIGGVVAQCRTIHTGEGPSRLVTYLGGAEVENALIVVACRQPAGQGGVHPLCANAMTF
jgi:hypothetical protein